MLLARNLGYYCGRGVKLSTFSRHPLTENSPLKCSLKSSTHSASHLPKRPSCTFPPHNTSEKLLVTTTKISTQPNVLPRLWPVRSFTSELSASQKDPKKPKSVLKRVARALGVAVWFVRTILWLAFLLLLAIVISWVTYENVPDYQKRAILSHFIPQIIPTVVQYANHALVARVLLRAVAFLTEDAALAADLCQRQALGVMLQLSRAGDVRLNHHIARALSNIAAIDSLRELVLDAGLCEALKEMELAARDADSPFTQSVVAKTYVSLARTISALATQPEMLERVLDAIEFDVLKHVYSMPQPEIYCVEITDALADLCNNNAQAVRLIRQGGLTVLEAIARNNLDDAVGINIARCLANCATDDQLAFLVAREGGLDILHSLVQYQLRTAPLDSEILRTLANLARDDQNKHLIVRGDWLDYIKQCSSRDAPPEVAFACCVALGNLAADAEAATLILERFQLRELAHLFTVQHQRSTRPHFARLLANLTKNERLVLRVYELMGDDVLERLVAGAADRMTLLSMARTLANFAANPKTAMELARSPLVRPMLIDLARNDDVDVVHQMVRTIANLAANAGAEVEEVSGLKQLLREWALSSDQYIRANAIRAEASLASVELKGGKFAEGVYLLYPLPPSTPAAAAASAASSAAAAVSAAVTGGGTAKSFKPEYDIVFIHGVGGDPYSTWAGGNPTTCWPRDWLPALFPKARIISVGYGIFLSRWSGQTLPLEEQARIIQKNLKLADVGSRPTVFVTHSFGGLILKQLLRNASTQDDYHSMLENTKGIVFYSVPHMGSDLTTYTDYLIADTLFQSSSAITELKPNSNFLKKLNEDFKHFAPHVATLSFGENDKTCYVTESTMSCWQVVSDQSANPNFEGAAHNFIKLDHNHREVCKPRDKNDPRFVHVVKFIRDATTSSQTAFTTTSASPPHEVANAGDSMATTATSYLRSMYKWN